MSVRHVLVREGCSLYNLCLILYNGLLLSGLGFIVCDFCVEKSLILSYSIFYFSDLLPLLTGLRKKLTIFHSLILPIKIHQNYTQEIFNAIQINDMSNSKRAQTLTLIQMKKMYWNGIDCCITCHSLDISAT